MKTFVKILAYLLVIALFAGIVGVIYKYTSGFNEDFKTFYVEYDGEKILSNKTSLELQSGKTHTFNVKYTFDRKDSERKDYSVKVVPNMSRDFDYTANGERFLFSKVKDFSSAFRLTKSESSFELTIPKFATLRTILSAYHGGAEIGLEQESVANNPNPFTLVVSSYNGDITYNISLIMGDLPAEVIKVCIDGTDVTNKYMLLYSGEFYVDVYAKINGNWVYVSESADIKSEFGGDTCGYILDISNVSISAYDYAVLRVSYGGKSAFVAFCTVDEGEDRWESL